MEVGNGRVRQSEEEMEVVMEEATSKAGRKAASRIQSKKWRIYLMPAEMEGDGVSNRECAFSD